jgi:hypothetical protein
LLEANAAGMVFATDSLPTNAEIVVTKMVFDDTVSPSLAEAIESALDAVKTIPDLSVPGLTVPAQPAEAAVGDQAAAVTETAGAQAGDLVGAAAGSGRAQSK